MRCCWDSLYGVFREDCGRDRGLGGSLTATVRSVRRDWGCVGQDVDARVGLEDLMRVDWNIRIRLKFRVA